MNAQEDEIRMLKERNKRLEEYILKNEFRWGERTKKMNAKQSLRAASKQIEELEYCFAAAAADIKRYNEVIQAMIAGGSPCDHCEERDACQLEAKGKGCAEWWLEYPKEEKHDETDPEVDETEEGGIIDGGNHAGEEAV